MGQKRIVLESFKFTEKEPEFTPRTPYYWMGEDEIKSIAKYPFISDFKCPFTAIFKVDGEVITLRGAVPKGFTYNLADIPFFVQPIAYDKHSPFVKNASFIHDYLLSHKRELYEFWEFKSKGITPMEFKRMTSLIFFNVLLYNAVPHGKAKLMTFFVDLFQNFLPSWRGIDVTECEL